MNKLIQQIVLPFLSIFLLSALVSGQAAETAFSFTVLDKGNNFYSGLKPADLRITVDKRPIQIASLTLKAGGPREVLILIDASISQERMIPDEQKAAGLFIDGVLEKGKDKVAIARFTGSISLVQDMTGDFEEAKKRLREIEVEPPPGYLQGGIMVGIPKISKDQVAMSATSIFDSVSKASEALAATKGDARKALLLISDGFNTYGEGKLNGTIKAAIEHGTAVYSIGIGDDFVGGVDKKTLKKLSEGTGGVSVIPAKKLADIGELVKMIGQCLASEYRLTFSSPVSGEKGELHEIDIEFATPELQKSNLRIIHPKGYFTGK